MNAPRAQDGQWIQTGGILVIFGGAESIAQRRNGVRGRFSGQALVELTAGA